MRKSILKVTTLVTSLLFAFALAATEMTFTWQIAIDRYLPGSTTSGVDNGTYQSTYATAKDLVEAKKELIADEVREGTVLLKNNNNALPLSEGNKVSLFSRSSVNLIYGSSSGGGKVTSPYEVKDVFESDGLEVNGTLYNYYDNIKGNYRTSGSAGYKTGEVDPDEYPNEVKSSYSQYGDAAIVFICRTFGEGNDASTDPAKVLDGDGVHNALELQDVERKVIAEAKKCSSKVIVVVNSDFMMGIDELKQDDEIDAILSVGSLGYSGIYGLADVITGKVSPSGHLADTIAASTLSAPAMQNFGDFTFTNADEIDAASATKYVVYQEGIYVGYKYYETRYEDTVLKQGNASSSTGAFMSENGWDYNDEVSYTFGYGLSYTTFDREITSIEWDETNKVVTLGLKTQNIGEVSGKDVFQVYVNSPYTQYDKDNNVEKAAVSLVGYTKSPELDPQEIYETTIDIDMSFVGSYDSHKAKTYILDYGTYVFGIGDSSHDALNNILAKKGYTTADGMDYTGDESQAITYEKTAEGDKEVDDVTLSTSEYTGNKITNQLDEADINHYGDMVTYLSRKDWAGTWSDGVELTATEEMIEDMHAGSSYTPSAESSDLSDVVEGVNYASTSTSVELSELSGKDYDDPLWDDLLNQLTLDEMSRLVGLANSGVIESINMPEYMAFDGPSGICASYITDDPEYQIYAAMFPSEVVLSCTFNQELANDVGEMFGNDGLWTGYHCVWGPGNDTHRTAFNGRNGEYYSEDGTLAYYQTMNEVTGAAKFGLSMGPKHFAFNDQETNRSGILTFSNEQAGREIYLRAFEGALTTGKANCTMIAKNRLGCKYIGAMPGLMLNILVDEWGYHGTVIADSASDGYVNGPTSIINGTTEFDTNTTEFTTGSLSPQAIGSDSVLFKAVKEACHRNLYLWANTWLTATVEKGTKVHQEMRWYQTLGISISAVTGALFAASLGLTVFFIIKNNRKREENN